MTRLHFQPRVALAVFLLAGLLLGGCGFKSRPLPLEKPLPDAPLDFSIRQLGSNMLVAWTIPELNQDETPITNLGGFNLYRMLYDPQDDCPDCLDRSTLLAKIDIDYPANVRVLDQRVYYFDRDVRPGKGYHYRVAARTRAGREGRPVSARLAAVTPTGTPTGLAANGHDRMVRLSWEPFGPEPGDTLLGYHIYRGLAGGPTDPAPVNNELLTDTGFDDFGVENGQDYSYQLRSVVQRGETQLESPATAAVTATPEAGQ